MLPVDRSLDGPADRRRPLAHPPALAWAGAAAAGWALAALALTVLTYADVAGQPLTAPDFGAGLLVFVRDLDPGRSSR